MKMLLVSFLMLQSVGSFLLALGEGRLDNTGTLHVKFNEKLKGKQIAICYVVDLDSQSLIRYEFNKKNVVFHGEPNHRVHYYCRKDELLELIQQQNKK